MTLDGYLAHISQGKPVNYENFLKCLPSEIANRHTRYFSTTRVGAQRWAVICEEPGLIEMLRVRASNPESRISAAVQGNSHRATTEAALLLVYHASLPDVRPAVVYLSTQETVQDFTPKSVALLIENQQNFLQSRAMLHIASSFLSRPLDLRAADVVYGGGSHINSARAAKWLSHYDEVICAFDYDLGGLRMFSALQKRLGEKARFLQPSDWTPFLKLFVNPPRTTERFLKAIELASLLGLNDLAAGIHKTGHFMEQESLLADLSAFE